MPACFFVSDLHGKKDLFLKLFRKVLEMKPAFVFIGGDLLPHFMLDAGPEGDFLNEFLLKELEKLKSKLDKEYPDIFVIPGNDDAAIYVQEMLNIEEKGYWHYCHKKVFNIKGINIFGYAMVPPTPFQLKDWEMYDVSRFVDPGCSHPDEGMRTVHVDKKFLHHNTIKTELEEMAEGFDFHNSVILFHTPPYKTALDRAALDGKMIDHAPLDVHVGSIAVMDFRKKYRPGITLHGHVHESTRLTGDWAEKTGSTYSFQAAHDGQELSLIIFDPDNPENAERLLV